MVKQVILIRKDLNMRKGKMVAQGAHASLAVILNLMERQLFKTSDKNTTLIERRFLSNEKSAINKWLEGSFTKVTLGVDSEEALERYFRIAQEANLLCSYIIDNGTTEFNGIKTPTAVAIGPAWSEDIDKITGDLKLL